MGDVTWVITSKDPDKIQLYLRYLPEEPWPWLGMMEIITHRDRADESAMRWIASQTRPRWPIRVRSDAMEEHIIKYGGYPPALNTFFADSLGIKLAIPLTHRTPILFTDDDIVVTRNPGYLMLDHMFASQSGLDSYTETAKDLEGLQAINDAFGMDIDLKTYNSGRTDEAVWYLPSIDLQEYRNQLCRYYSHPHLVRIAADTGNAPHGHTQRFRKSGMRFNSGFLIYRTGVPIKSPHYRALAEKTHPVNVPGSTFVHYCASGQKIHYMRWLEENLRVRS